MSEVDTEFTPESKYGYVSVEEAYGKTPDKGYKYGVTADAVYSQLTPWQINMAGVVADAKKKAADPTAMDAYVDRRFVESGRAYAKQFQGGSAQLIDHPDPTIRKSAEQEASMRFWESLAPDRQEAVSTQFRGEFQAQGAMHESLSSFLQARHAMAQQLLASYKAKHPKWTPEEIQKNLTADMQKKGFEPTDAERKDLNLPPLPTNETDYVPALSEISNFGAGILKGTYQLGESGFVLGTAIGEAFHTPKTEQVPGYGKRVGARVSEDADPYAKQRLYMDALRKRVDANPIMRTDPVPYLGGTDIAGALGQTVPQIYAMASGALAARGATMAGKAGEAFFSRATTMGVMYALEGSSAYTEYIQQAQARGLDPADAAKTALGGALVYGAASAALEMHGPFNFLEKKLPGIKRKLVAMALTGLMEGSTEFSQSIAQSAISYGLDLRDLNWANVQKDIRQAAVEGVVGAIAGVGTAAVMSETPGPGTGLAGPQQVSSGPLAPAGGPNGPNVIPFPGMPGGATPSVPAGPAGVIAPAQKALPSIPGAPTLLLGPSGLVIAPNPQVTLEAAKTIVEETDAQHSTPRVLPFIQTPETMADAKAASGNRIIQFPTELVAPPSEGPGAPVQPIVPPPGVETAIPPTRISPPTVVQLPTVEESVRKRHAPQTGETVEQENARLRKELEAARAEARTDSLTGLGNKRQYDETIGKHRETADQTGRPFSVILFDAANLKAANTLLGHEGANDLLKQFGDTLRGPTEGRAGDTIVTRQGGDEFAVILPNTDEAGARRALERLEQAVGRKQIAPGFHMFLAGGVATYVPGTDLDAALKAADEEVEARKQAVKQELGDPTTRSEADALVARLQAEAAEKADATPAEEEQWADQHLAGESPEDTMNRIQDEMMRERGEFATTLQRTLRLTPRAKRDAAKVGQIAYDTPGAEVTQPHRTYEEGSKNLKRPSKNVWVRQTVEKSNAKRVLLLQWSSDLLQSGTRNAADAYYDKLYDNRNAEGYARADDFWELPQWIGQAAHNLDNVDVYVVRDIQEAIKFAKAAGYGSVAMSVLDVNKKLARQFAEGYNGRIDVGGYVDLHGVFDKLVFQAVPPQPETALIPAPETAPAKPKIDPLKAFKGVLDFGGDLSPAKAKKRAADLAAALTTAADASSPMGVRREALANIRGELASALTDQTVWDEVPNLSKQEQAFLAEFAILERELFGDSARLNALVVALNSDTSSEVDDIQAEAEREARAIGEEPGAVPAAEGHVHVWESMQAWVESQDKKFSKGTNYRHFAGTRILPRLTMSEGCKHGCAFCCVSKELKKTSRKDILKQVDSFADLDAALVYLNDKTFGQADNYEMLPELYQRMKKRNPDFQGFVIQTTAAQMKKLSPKFLQEAGIKFVELGVESYNDGILKENKKPANRKIIDDAVAKLRAAGIAFIPNILIGLPQETAETYEATLNFLEGNQDIISHANIYNLAVYTGTALADTVQSTTELDTDENQVAKSFHKDPALHQKFADDVYALAQRLLDNPPVGLREPETQAYEQTAERVEATPAPETMEDVMPEESIPDGAPQAGFVDGLKAMLDDEQGFFDPVGLSEGIGKGVHGVASEVSTIAGAIHGLVLDESAPLRKTPAGQAAVAIVDEAEARHRRMRAPLIMAYDAATKNMPGKQKRALKQWLYAMREDGQTNYATAIEHPERVQQWPPGARQVVAAYEATVLAALGNAAEDARIPQLRAVYDAEGNVTWRTMPFQRAQDSKYLRLYTQEGMDLMAFQDRHELWDSLIAWGQQFPERNPHLDFDDPEHLRVQLEGARQGGKTKKAGSLEYIRIFKELPIALKNPKTGKWVDIQMRDPRGHFLAAVENQSRRIALWTTAEDFLLQRYGTFNPESGRIEYPLNHNPDLVDVDGLIDRLRSDVVRSQPGKTAATEASFNRLLDNYQRTHFGGYMEEYLVTMGQSKLAKLATAVDRSVTANVLMLSPMWDIFNPSRSVAVVGMGNMLKGYASALADIFANPRGFAAEYQAMGAVIDGHTEWTVHRETWFDDAVLRNFPQAMTTMGRFSEIYSQFTIARMYDLWVKGLNSKGNLTVDQARLLRDHMRLTNAQILEISQGRMSNATRAKVLQNAVNTVAGLTEAQHRKGAIQNNPLGKFAFRFLSVVNAVTRASVRHVTDISNHIKTAMDPTLPLDQRQQAGRDALRAGWRLLLFVAALAGSGWLQKYLRRAVTGQPLVNVDDPEGWGASLMSALAEGGIYGPFYRVAEANKYSRDNLFEMPSRLVFPLAVTAEIGSAMLGFGRYRNSPWSRRLQDLGLQFTPVWRASKNWVSQVQYPTRATYMETRGLVRQYNKGRGIEPKPGFGEDRNYEYYAVFEAIRDGDEEGLAEALTVLKGSGHQAGIDGKTIRERLRSSLMSHRPINLSTDTKDNQYRKFLQTLTDEQRAKVKQENDRYTKMMDRITKPPRTKAGDWYGTK